MAALDFPSSPSLNDVYSANGKTYVWNGTSWINNTPGFTGSQGATGFTGSAGTNGFTGSRGTTGFTGSASTVAGPTGFTGSAGTNGFTGSRGEQGFTGSQGIQGVIGFTGSKGDTGTTGFTGSKGDQGVIGFTGSKGDQGVIGYTGSRGATGFTGSKGDTGSQGVIGYTGSTGDDVNQYTLAAPWDINGATYEKVFSVSTQESTPQGIAFSTDGTKMYVIGSTGDDVNQYTLTTAWDVATATYEKVFSVSAQETSPTSITFSVDGTKMFMLGFSGQDVNQYVSSQTLPSETLQIDNISVAVGQTTLQFTSTDTTVVSVQVDGRSAAQPYTTYEYDNVNEYITAKTDKIVLPNGKRFAKMKITGDLNDEVINAKINLWKL